MLATVDALADDVELSGVRGGLNQQRRASGKAGKGKPSRGGHQRGGALRSTA